MEKPLEHLSDRLLAVINKFIEVSPEQYPKHPNYYLYSLTRDIEHVRKEAVLYACKMFWEKELWDKSLSYFRAMIINENSSITSKIEKEKRAIGGVPKDII